ncbi:MAG: FGGY-family carbohydrate kinase [Myxococcaceae bacterium]|nr:FGGY-family carbohydrate kinase [Myxococcaceae bacterium]
MSSVLALDLGTSGLKAAVFDPAGAVIDSEVVPYSVQLSPGGGAEQHPDTWWQAVVTAATRMFARKAKASGVRGVAVSSQWAGTVAIDEAGKALRPALIWMDSRGSDDVRALAGGFPSIDGYNAFKIEQWIRKTGGAPSLSGKDPVGHIAWLRRNEPKTFDATKLFLEPKDWLNFKLTGRAVSSFDAIAMHWATDNRKVDAVQYDDGLLKLANLERSKLPELIAPAAVVGTLSAEAATELGLPRDVKVITGGPDMHTAAIGAGTTRDFEVHLCLGTSSWLLAHVPFKKTDLTHNMGSLPAAIPGRYLFCNEQEMAAGALKWVVEKLFEADGADVYPKAFAAAEATPAGAKGLMFLPWLHGERSPVDDRNVRGGFVGLSLHHDRGHLVRAVLEGVAYNTRWLLEHLQRNMGRPVEQVTVVGGGARSDFWCQVMADALQCRVRQVVDPQLANARGAAFQAWVGLGEADWNRVAEAVAIRRTFEPNTAHAEVHRERYAQFHLEFNHRRKMSRRFPRLLQE